MDIKAENSRRIRELEAEFSDEVFAEQFHMRNTREIYFRGWRRQLTKKEIIRFIRDLIIPVACIIVTLQFFSPRIVYESSMEHTLTARDYVVLATHAYDSPDAVDFEDIVILSSSVVGADGEKRDLIKRVIGLPGDWIEIQGGSVYRNGARLEEPYTMEGRTDGSFSLRMVPEGCLFVLGDNRQGSVDSRDDRIGFVPMDRIQGKVIFRIFPISRAERFL